MVGYEAVVAAYNRVVKDMELEAWIVVPSTIMLMDDVTDEYLAGRGISLQ